MNYALGIVLLCLGLIVALLVLFMPSVIASVRKHPQETAIFVCNLLVFIFPPAWAVALVWAFINQAPTAPATVAVAPTQRRTAAPPRPEILKGRYRVSGIDEESGLQTAVVVTAKDLTDAKLAGLEKGIKVQRVESV